MSVVWNSYYNSIYSWMNKCFRRFYNKPKSLPMCAKVKVGPPNVPSTQNCHHHSRYISKINMYPCGRNKFRTPTKIKLWPFLTFASSIQMLDFLVCWNLLSLAKNKIWNLMSLIIVTKLRNKNQCLPRTDCIFLSSSGLWSPKLTLINFQSWHSVLGHF